MAPANSLLSSLESFQIKTRQCRSRSSQLRLRNSRCRNGLVMKKRVRRFAPALERKVRTLKKLIPNCEAMGVERLFRETADYIVALQMRVKVMQIVVGALSPGNDDE